MNADLSALQALSMVVSDPRSMGAAMEGCDNLANWI